MKYELLIKRRAQKQLASIPHPNRNRIIAAIRYLAENPRPTGAKKLTGREAWRILIGDYRVIYLISEDEKIVWLYDAMHRKKVYK